MKTLPDLIQRYVTAQNSHDVEQRMLCFASDATVHDESELLQGEGAIRNWMLKTEAKYAQKMKVLECMQQEGELILTAETSGNFAGSPISLDYHFTVENSRISSLKVKLTPRPLGS